MRAELADPQPDMRWLTAHLTQFVPGPRSVGARGVTKRCAELAMTYSYLRAWVREGSLPADPFAAELDAWQATLQRRCEDPALRRRALQEPDAALFHAQPYLWLRATGYRHDAWEHALAGLASDGVRPGSMGLLHLLWKAGLMRRQPDWSRALVRWLSAWGDHPGAWDHNAYRITHAAFYISDLGNQAPPVALADRDRLSDRARRLLVRSVAQRRWDLTGELLIALTCLGGEDSTHPQATRAFCGSRPRVLSAGSGQTDGAGHGAEPAENPDEAFRRRYHTTIVAVLHCATAARFAGGRHRRPATVRVGC
jgi:uncharacterized protein DUF6895